MPLFENMKYYGDFMKTEKKKINSIAILALIFSIFSILLYQWFNLFPSVLAIVVSIIGIFDINKHNDGGKVLAIVAIIISVLVIVTTTTMKNYCMSHYDEVNPMIPQLLGIEDDIEKKKEEKINKEYKEETKRALTEIGIKKVDEIDTNLAIEATKSMWENLGSIFSGIASILGIFV